MENILFVNACVRTESRTRILAQTVLESLGGSVTELQLQQENIPVLDAAELSKRDALLAAEDYAAPMLRYARQFAAADSVVIAAPYWDLMFPALLKIWFEAITVSGVTFRYGPDGIPQSLCKAKKLVYVTTAGGPVFANFGWDYARTMAQGFFGINDCRLVMAEGLDIIGADVDSIMAKATEEARYI